MGFLLAIAARNLVRNSVRTALTGAAVLFGVAILIFGWGLVDGIDDNMLRSARHTYAGDIILRPEGYPDDGMRYPLADARPVPAALRTRLDAVGPWTARTAVPARLVLGAEGQRVTIWGYDEATELQVFDRKGWAIEGRFPASGQLEVALGRSLARLLEAEVGASVVLEARTADGAINALAYTVSAIVKSDNSSMDALGVWMPLSRLDELAVLHGVATHIAVLSSMDPTAAAATLTGFGFTPLMLVEECEDLIAVNRIRRRSLGVIVGMILLIAGVGIANTVIMAAFERIREIGTLLALGMSRRHVSLLFLFEGGIMGLCAGLLGAALGSGAVLYFEVHGLDLSAQLKDVGANLSMASMIYTHFSWPSVFAALGFGVTIAVLASVWPARLASSTVPADAVRAD
ncbi:MAG: ABC transporter permease [Myxococcales bacterium]|nr:ABC transporter permease [Myxococcales bacterium]